LRRGLERQLAFRQIVVDERAMSLGGGNTPQNQQNLTISGGRQKLPVWLKASPTSSGL
jgi:hypothetical protein